MKKIISYILLLTVVSTMFLSGCSKTTETSTSNDSATTATESEELAYPEKPITLLITFEAGGTTDVATRLFVKYWQKNLPENVNVINIDGSGGNVGIAEAKKQDNDGYYLVVQSAPFAMNAALGTATFTWEEFEPISLFFESYMALCVHKDSPYQTFEELQAAIQADSDSIKYGVYAGSPMMSTFLALQDHMGVDLNIIDIPSTKSTELLAGRIDTYCDAFPQMKSYIDSGDFRCLGVFAPERLEEYPDIPTMKEMGIDYVITEQKYGMWAPEGTPDEILEYLNKTIEETYNDPEFAEELSSMSFVPTYTTREEYETWLTNIYADYAAFVEAME